MIHPVVLGITGVLMAMVGLVLTVLCAVWAVPAWRRRLGGRRTDAPSGGWFALAGNTLVFLGIGAGALVAWYGCYWVMAALIA